MQPRDMIVIGGSIGSIESLTAILASLPDGFPASIFIVVHMPADYPSQLPALFSRAGPLPATHATDLELIRHGHIFVARPDHHLLIEDGKVRVQRGPRENRHRPAIDPLFRTAARDYGPRVIGVLLSGLQDDGSAGLYAVKRRGGIAVVQDPSDTPWGEMPTNALRYASPQYVLRAADIAGNLIQFVTAGAPMTTNRKSPGLSKRKSRGKKAARRSANLERPAVNLETSNPEEGQGTPSVFACPECHGVLWEFKNDKMVHFRCRVGHSYGTESLTRELSLASESALWAAVRALEEKAAMQRRAAEGMRSNLNISHRLLDQSAADTSNALLIRSMIFRRDAELESESPQPESSEAEPKKRAGPRKKAA